MRIHIDVNENYSDIEVVIKTPVLNDDVIALQKALTQISKQNMTLTMYRGFDEYFVHLEDIIFFETSSNNVYAHTKKEVYQIKHKLYELEDMLPGHFCRVSKSGIVNTKQIYALNRSFSGASVALFYDSMKEMHISRHYYKVLKDKMNEVR